MCWGRFGIHNSQSAYTYYIISYIAEDRYLDFNEKLKQQRFLCE